MNSTGLAIEIIVVDNGSVDNTASISLKNGARVIKKDTGTIASLRNCGVSASSGHLISFLDADCVVPIDWLEKSVIHLGQRDDIVLGFRFGLPDNANWIARSWDLLFAKRYVTAEVEWIPSGNMIMKREAFLAAQGFDEALETNEDYDFCFRVRQRGCKVISSSETTVTHLRPPQSIIELFRKELWHGKEVFSSFLKDIFHQKDFRIHRTKNFNVVFYAFFCLLCALIILASLLYSFYSKTVSYFIMALLLSFIPPSCLAIKTVVPLRKYRLVLGLTIVLIIYGYARAVSLFSFFRS